MNVAPSNATSPSVPVKGDPTTGVARVVLGPDSGSVDTPVESAATVGDDFGRILSRGLVDLAGTGVVPSGPKQPADPAGLAETASTEQALPVATGRITGFGVGSIDPPGGPAAPRSDKTTDDDAAVAAPGTAPGLHNEAAANDLAAQLALVSQWAGIAKSPMPAPTSTLTSTGGTADGLAIQDKLATVRGTSPKEQRATASSAQVGVPDEPAVPPPFAIATLQGAKLVDRGGPGTAESATVGVKGVDAKRDDTKSRTEAVAATAGDRPSLGEIAIGKLDAGSARAPSDLAAVPSNTFVTQITAAVANVASPVQASADSAPTLGIREPVGTPAWSREVGQATLRIAANDLQTASLQLNPEHLGPLDVQVRIDNGVAHLTFNAAHADTRQAIESSRPALDQLFSDQGLKIGDCAVGDSSTSRRNFDADAAQSGQSQRDGSGRQQQPGAAPRDAANDGSVATLTTRLKALGLVDTFA